MKSLEREIKSVMIVDDQEAILDFLPHFLLKKGYDFKMQLYNDNPTQIDEIVEKVVSGNINYLFCDGLYGKCIDLYHQLIRIDPSYSKKFVLITDSLNALAEEFKIHEKIQNILEKNRDGNMAKTILNFLEEKEKAESAISTY